MNQRAVIGITTQNLRAIKGIPEIVPDSWMMSQRFILAPVVAGAIPWLIPLLNSDTETLRSIYEHLDGLLLPGGADVDPGSYNEEPHPQTEGTDPPRDEVELKLVEWALEDGMPILGLCRGFQIVNLALGGTLYQDIEQELPGAIKHDYLPRAGYARDRLSHDVQLVEGSRLATIVGEPAMAVNSMHHQGIRDLGRGLVATAIAPDGLVEGFEMPSHPFLIAVQWHPEALSPTDPRMRRLFVEFVEAAAQFRTSRRVANLGQVT
ncbi:MAG: gamma-glutamyl-gamma-aminobutyrate hydrolase family protein [Gemmatimonadales bacterium]|nr:gamma-glutamyl-gamma-aminobutyrate hydrolase family protein [Gemmatimonadales bacterium]